MPDRPEELEQGAPLINDGLGRCLFVGTKDTLICEDGGFNPRLLSGRVPEVKPYLSRISGSVDYSDRPHE
ncbi:hypothetical protein [Flagellimonas lutaonensis]|uniref:hypothetical protein n=1 Tax=Flagellimonas lutaonensis TaxID=516051 RepID=UPI000697F219|nr:hypothetical protein [Allomuricauda lutaonensis]